MKKLKDEYDVQGMPGPSISSNIIKADLKIGPNKTLELFKYLRDCGVGEIYTQMTVEGVASLFKRGVIPRERTLGYRFVFGETDNAEYDARMAAVQTHQSEQGRARRSSLPFVLDAGWIMPARED